MDRVKRRDSALPRLVRELLLPTAMRRASLCLLVGLVLAFEINCGSVTSDGSGMGGSVGTGGGHSGGSYQTGTGGSGGGNAGTHGGSGGQAGAGAISGSGGQGGNVAATGGAGGDHASGGAGGHASGGGGGHATGGAAGSGAGTGGHAGTGGSATGGHGGGGQGGQTVDSGVSCAELATEYSAAFPAAEACTPGAANQCQQLVPITLGICTGCEHYVTDATTLNAIHTQWTNQGCNLTTALIVCPAIACVNPGTAGACVGTDGSPNGICGLGITQLTPAN